MWAASGAGLTTACKSATSKGHYGPAALHNVTAHTLASKWNMQRHVETVHLHDLYQECYTGREVQGQ